MLAIFSIKIIKALIRLIKVNFTSNCAMNGAIYVMTSRLTFFPPSRSISDSLLSFSHRSLITTTFLVCSASLLINRFKSESHITFQSIDSAFASRRIRSQDDLKYVS